MVPCVSIYIRVYVSVTQQVSVPLMLHYCGNVLLHSTMQATASGKVQRVMKLAGDLEKVIDCVRCFLQTLSSMYVYSCPFNVRVKEFLYSGNDFLTFQSASQHSPSLKRPTVKHMHLLMSVR